MRNKLLRRLACGTIALTALLWAVPRAAAAEAAWCPADAPLRTRWAAEVSPEHVHPEYPRPQMVRRQWQSLNGLWQMSPAKAGEQPPLGRDLPGRILVPFPVESSLSGVGRHYERLWYRRQFEVPPEYRGRRVQLNFGAVDWETTVWLNGHELGTHRGGYDSFSFDITDYLNRLGPQELVVGVADPTDRGDQPRGKQADDPKGIYYTSCTGIWQSVWIEPVSTVHIARLNIVPDVDARCVRVTVEAAGAGNEHTVQAEVYREGRKIAEVYGGVDAEIRVDVPLESLRLWSPEDPFLYDLTVTLKRVETPVDEVQGYFGMRKVDVGPDREGRMRLRLNGRDLFLIGVLDQGYWPEGVYTAPTDTALRADVQIARDFGFKLVRKHLKVEPARWYYWCDKLGLLVWQEMPSGDNGTPESREQFAAELRAMIDGHSNHPSIMLWSVFNEAMGQHDTERYARLVQQRDPSRPVCAACGWNDQSAGDVLASHEFPGPTAPEADGARAGMVGKFGGLGLPIEGHAWSGRAWGYRSASGPRELGARYQQMLAKAWELERGGLSGAVYVQLTDVETECNGLLTYDRAVIKLDLAKARAANLGPQASEAEPPNRRQDE
ncbi:MAG: glycoside hydrolase family 2 protein [Planctomycetota bacterium]